MSDSYRLSDRQARICRIAALMFAIAAASRILAVLLPLMLSQSPTLEVRCGPAGCASAARYELQLPEGERPPVMASPAALGHFIAYTRQPAVRVSQAAIDLLAAAPFALLMACVAAALIPLGGPHDQPYARALRWLQKASLAALATALVPPVADSLRAMLLLPGTPGGPAWYFAVDFGALLGGFMLSLAVLIVTWAIAAGERARDDVGGFI